MVQFNNILGFEDYGVANHQANAVSNVSAGSYNTSTPMTGVSHLELSTAATAAYAMPFIGIRNIEGTPYDHTDAGSGWIAGFRFRKDSNPASEGSIAKHHTLSPESGDAPRFRININASGQLVLIDHDGTTLDTSFALSNDTQYYIELYWTDGGAWEWFINGSTEGSGTGANFIPVSPGELNDNARFQLQNAALGPLYSFDDVYIKSGCTSSSDRESGSTAEETPRIFYSQNDAGNTATPDFAGNGSTGGDDLGSGTWSAVATWPVTGTPVSALSIVEYTTASANGSVTCPYPEDLNDVRCVQANIWAVRGAGASSAFWGFFGRSGVTTSAVWRGTINNVGNFLQFPDTDVSGLGGTFTSASVPIIGFGKGSTGGQDQSMGTSWVEVLHIPAAAGSAGSAVASVTPRLLLMGVGMPDR